MSDLIYTEAKLLKFFAIKENFDRYKHLVTPNTFLKESEIIFHLYDKWFKNNPTDIMIDFDKFRLTFRLDHHKEWKKDKIEMFEYLISIVEKETIDPIIIQKMIEQDYATKIYTHAYDIVNGKPGATAAGLESLIKEFNDKVSNVQPQNNLIQIDANEFAAVHYSGKGLSWRVREMNLAVGDLHQSDFIMIGKRPETGGTSFMISEFTYMLNQLTPDKKAIIFNNEEGGYKIAGRVLQSLFNITTKDILADPGLVNTKFMPFKDKIDVFNKSDMNIHDIENILKSNEYSLIGINILEKVRGFSYKKEEYERFAALSNWCRNLANTYGVVFAIVQSDNTAEGQKWANQSQLYKSKTAVQQETDVMIMIGKTDEPSEQDTRFISICRNKKPCTGMMDPTWKYAKFELFFDHETGLYKSKIKPGK